MEILVMQNLKKNVKNGHKQNFKLRLARHHF